VAARIETVVDGLRIQNDDIVRKHRVERALELRRIECPGQRERRHLPARVHAGIGAAGGANSHEGRENPLQSGLDTRLDRILTALELPSAVVGPLVLDDELDLQSM
jgi:hypothetical protein